MSPNHTGGTDKTKTVRPLVVSVRLSKQEKQTIATHADNQRLSASAYMRICSLKSRNGLSARKSVPISEGKQIALVLACLGRLMDMLKSYAKDEEHQDRQQQIMFAALRREIMAVRDQCFNSLRRKP
ncbi:MAG: hypothetical protein COA69_03415 [Robiginitomaculum sp.]|nr:MAG: hypothetical protein COA69_03415 [Robiginitomaculum sp.]